MLFKCLCFMLFYWLEVRSCSKLIFLFHIQEFSTNLVDKMIMSVTKVKTYFIIFFPRNHILNVNTK